jgi:hypothetical protein
LLASLLHIICVPAVDGIPAVSLVRLVPDVITVAGLPDIVASLVVLAFPLLLSSLMLLAFFLLLVFFRYGNRKFVATKNAKVILLGALAYYLLLRAQRTLTICYQMRSICLFFLPYAQCTLIIC